MGHGTWPSMKLYICSIHSTATYIHGAGAVLQCQVQNDPSPISWVMGHVTSMDLSVCIMNRATYINGGAV